MANYTESWNRLEQVICWAKMSTNHFAHHIGLLRPDILYHIKAGKIGLSKNLVQRIVEKYPEISPGWLLTGEGVMLREGSRLINYVEGGIAELKRMIEGGEDAPTSQYISLPMVGDCDYAYRSYDEAMADQIMPGTIVFLKKTDLSAIIQGDRCVVVGDNFILLRCVKVKHSAEGCELELSTLREGDCAVRVAASQVRSIYRVVGTLKLWQ